MEVEAGPCPGIHGDGLRRKHNPIAALLKMGAPLDQPRRGGPDEAFRNDDRAFILKGSISSVQFVVQGLQA